MQKNIEMVKKLALPMARLLNGTNFLLVMEHDAKNPGGAYYADYSYHPRFGLPCQGGELRKYKSSHGEENCTQPHNSRPTDLHFPFPEVGTPYMLLFNLSGYKINFVKEVALHSPWSPYIGTPSFDGNVLILSDLDKCDPTVLVSFLFFIRSKYSDTFKNLFEVFGMTKFEALAAMMMGVSATKESVHFGASDGYHFPKLLSPSRFFNSIPNNFSGGVFSKRVDYNRTFVQDVFSSNVSHKDLFNFAGSFENKGKDPVEVFRLYVKGIYDLEVKTKDFDCTYKYRDQLGRILEIPQTLKFNEKAFTPVSCEKDIYASGKVLLPKSEQEVVIKSSKEKAA